MLRKVVFPEDYPDSLAIDLNGDGTFDEDDAIMAYEVFTGQRAMSACPGAQTTQVTVCISMGDPEKLIRIYGTNMWGSEVEVYIGGDANNSSFASRSYLDRMITCETADLETLCRTTQDGKEYLNPPLEEDTEYRTYDQYKGSTVYKKLDSATGRLLWKTTGDWSTYAKMMGAFPGFMRILTVNDDMDDITDDGIYVYSTSSVPANAPFANAAVVMVFGADSTTTQKVQIGIRYGEGGHFKFRALYASSWHAWAEVLNSVRGSYELLWENASKISAFAAQTITLDTREYNHLLVVCGYNKSMATGQTTTPVWMRAKGSGDTAAYLMVDYVTSSGSITTPYRKLTIASNRASVTFGGGYKLDGTASDENVIPYYIYGLKGV